MHEAPGLFASAAQKEPAPSRVDLIGQALQRVQASGVNGGHVALPQNHDRRQFGDLLHQIVDLVGSAEQEWPMNTEHCGIWRDILVLKYVQLALVQVLGRNARNSSRRSD